MPRAQQILQWQVSAEAVHAGPFHADAQAMTVNEQPFDVLGVQFGFEASIPRGLRLALDNGYIEVDRHGAVRACRGCMPPARSATSGGEVDPERAVGCRGGDHAAERWK